MNETVNKAITTLAERITDKVTPDEALRFTQAALNLMHVLQVQVEIDSMKKE